MDNSSLQPYWYQHHRYHSSISRDPPKSPYRAASHQGHGNPHYTDHSLSNSTVFFSDYPHPSSGANISSMVSSAEPRKQADYHDSPNRQALPSISEAIQGTEPAPYTFRPPSSIQTGSSLPRLSHSFVDHYPRPRSTHICSSYCRPHPSLPDNMLFPLSRILLGHLSPACRHFLLSLTAARVPQPRGGFLPSITTPSSRRHRILIILSAECMHTLLRHLRLQLRLPISPANYAQAGCLCPLIRPLPGTIMLLQPGMTPQLTGTLGAGATKIL
ncbi:hypothetical protein RAB80_017352 [Fusarium oxysporum f. sp. vasinfectum]|nr:hypothetical protein RAB80_017352 [Fusarium oxysporum f. sp. vasinfectum]